MANFQEFVHGEVHILGDLAQERGRDIATGVKRQGGATPVRMTVLAMRASLANLHEAEPFK